MKTLLALILGFFALKLVGKEAEAHAETSGTSARRDVVGKSGHKWFVGALPSSDPNVVAFAVFNSETGLDPVLHYDQNLKTGERHVTFTAPSTLGQTASADFV